MNTADCTFGDLLVDKARQLLSAPDAAGPMRPSPALDAAGNERPDAVQWSVTVMGTLPCDPALREALLADFARLRHLGTRDPE